MGRTRRSPFRGFVDHISEMNRTREHWMTGDISREEQRRNHATAWTPTTDIFARGDDLVIRSELAGVYEEDIDVTLSNGVLVISGERKGAPDEEEVNYYARERSYGRFRRTMTLPEDADESKIDATFEEGMLEIIVRGGAAAARPRRVQIRKRPG